MTNCSIFVAAMAASLNFSCVVVKEEGIYTSNYVLGYTTTTERSKLYKQLQYIYFMVL